MENKKLLKILRKDMSELEELIADVKMQKSFNEFEMEFIHTRAKGVKQLIHLINLNDNDDQDTPVSVKEERFEQIKETVAEIQESIVEHQPDTVAEVEDTKEKEIVLKEEVQPVVAEEKFLPNETEEQNNETEVSHQDENEDDMLQEESEITQANARLGDSFLKGKSVNDMIPDQNKLEFKLSNRPVSSIKTSIGINDRFQYIRELFNGNSEKFAETVTALDSMNDIKEAVDYLRQNFKWRKNETSLKFVHLVKRRFQ